MDLWPWIHEERASILETFEGLTADQWDVPSLCGQWNVRQVLGHLVVAANPPTGQFAIEVVKARGSFDRANDRLARLEAEQPTAELIARYRELFGERNTPPGLGPAAPLGDILLHSLDVRIPLGLPSDRPPERYTPALEMMFGRIGSRVFVPKGRPDLHWVATDHLWTHGTGEAVEGTMADLTMAASGRGARVDALTGPGQRLLAAWFSR
ncbi:MAG: maleylpyruvate isomerase family mycothiol-dependent enzyme [Acidimicrobiales bacterium]